MPYRPFGRFRAASPLYPVGDQWPDAPEELRAAIDPKTSVDDYNRFERAIYRWLAHPRLLPFRRRRPADPDR